jgi:hypothetical protein
MKTKHNDDKPPDEVVIIDSAKALPVVICGVQEAPARITLLPIGMGIIQMIGDIEDDGLLNGSAAIFGGAY